MSWTKLGDLTWANRDATEFFDSIVKSSGILKRFTIYDGVKSKKEIPIFEAEIVYDDKMCAFDPQSSADIDEKEFSVSFRRWGFQNCKNALEDSYREVGLKKGQLNAETLDSDFKEWVYDRFVKKNASNIVNWSWNGNTSTEGGDILGIKAEAEADSEVISVDGSTIGATLADSSTILDHIEKAYLSIPSPMLDAMFGDAEEEEKPVVLLGTKAYQSYLVATSKYGGVEYEGIEKGLLKKWMGMEVVHYSPLSDTEMVITSLSNLVIVTDDYSDTNAIQAKYDEYTNSDNIWGQFKIGFSYKYGDRIVLYKTV